MTLVQGSFIFGHELETFLDDRREELYCHINPSHESILLILVMGLVVVAFIASSARALGTIGRSIAKDSLILLKAQLK